jgi:hypothetical protein
VALSLGWGHYQNKKGHREEAIAKSSLIFWECPPPMGFYLPIVKYEAKFIMNQTYVDD